MWIAWDRRLLPRHSASAHPSMASRDGVMAKKCPRKRRWVSRWEEMVVSTPGPPPEMEMEIEMGMGMGMEMEIGLDMCVSGIASMVPQNEAAMEREI